METADRFVIPVEALTFSSEIGEGSSARMYKGLLHNSTVAFKRSKLGKGIPKYQELLKKEAENLICLQHRNVVKCLGIYIPKMTCVGIL